MLGKFKKFVNLVKNHGLIDTATILRDWAVGRRQPEESEICFRLLSKTGAMTMVDVGAHLGDSLEPFAGAGWQVVAFEPDPSNRAQLIRRFGSTANVIIDGRAVSEQHGFQPFYTSTLSTGISTLAPFDSTHSRTLNVSTVPLRDALSDAGVFRVDFLKIDTEGHDLFVLRSNDWKSIVPALILCEFEDRKTKPLGYDFHALSGFLVTQGYRVMVSEWYPIRQYGRVGRWRRFCEYPCDLVDGRAWGNLIACREDLWESLVALCKAESIRAGKR